MAVTATITQPDPESGPFSLDNETKVAFVTVTLSGTYDANKVVWVGSGAAAVSYGGLADLIGWRDVYQIIPLNADGLATRLMSLPQYDRNAIGLAGERLSVWQFNATSNKLEYAGGNTTTGLVFDLLVFGR